MTIKKKVLIGLLFFVSLGFAQDTKEWVLQKGVLSKKRLNLYDATVSCSEQNMFLPKPSEFVNSMYMDTIAGGKAAKRFEDANETEKLNILKSNVYNTEFSYDERAKDWQKLSGFVPRLSGGRLPNALYENSFGCLKSADANETNERIKQDMSKVLVECQQSMIVRAERDKKKAEIEANKTTGQKIAGGVADTVGVAANVALMVVGVKAASNGYGSSILGFAFSNSYNDGLPEPDTCDKAYDIWAKKGYTPMPVRNWRKEETK